MIGKIRNLNNSSSGGTVNLLDTLSWVSTDSKIQIYKKSDGSQFIGFNGGSSDASGTITSDFFSVKKTDVLSLIGLYYRKSAWGHLYVNLLDCDGTQIFHYDDNNDDDKGKALNKFISFSKTKELSGSYRLALTISCPSDQAITYTISQFQIN